MHYQSSFIPLKVAFWLVFIGFPVFVFAQNTNPLAAHQTNLSSSLDSPTAINTTSNLHQQSLKAEWVATVGMTKAVSCAGGNDGSASVWVSSQGNFSYQWDEAAGHQTGATANQLSAGSYTVTVTEASGYTQSIQVNITEPARLQVEAQDIATPQHRHGANGSISVMVEGGVGTYDYQWSDTTLPNSPMLENLPCGTYELTVTDARGCQTTFGLTLLDPLP